MTSYLRYLITVGSIAMSSAGLAYPQVPLTPTPVPSAIQVPEGSTAFLKGHAVGTQNYTCVPSATGYFWKGALQATLFVNLRWRNIEIPQQIATHFLSPNPSENGTPRPTWQSSVDTSAVWGNPIANSSDPAFVAPGAIPWLLLQVVGAQRGPAGGEALIATTYIQRVNTAGGVAPALPCSEAENPGVAKFVPYAADYVFYKGRSKQ
ncbi:MAG TPA: DUF3455 domain-containing protein [Bryobacteraceae bacterium]|nr:DUF3455 domain-containing protein [Bryobacteraceae bacterium]